MRERNDLLVPLVTTKICFIPSLLQCSACSKELAVSLRYTIVKRAQ